MSGNFRIPIPPGFVCSLCLFGDLPPAEDGEERDLRLTVINGQMVCVEHQGYVNVGDMWRARQQVMKESGSQ